jgi:hypothetical protein
MRLIAGHSAGTGGVRKNKDYLATCGIELKVVHNAALVLARQDNFLCQRGVRDD